MIELIESEAKELVSILEDFAGFGGSEMSLRASHYEGLLRQRLAEAGIKPDDSLPTPRQEMKKWETAI